MTPQPKRIEKGLWWDRAWKLVEGCTHVSPGCDNCWSAREAHMRAGQGNEKIKEQYSGLTEGARWNGQIRLMEKNLDLPLRVKKPQVWAVWNDLFHEDVPDKFIFNAFSKMSNAQCFFGHTFIVLTKRPERMKTIIAAIRDDLAEQAKPVKLPDGRTRRNLVFSFPLRNIWLGVTAENQEQADKRIPVLLQIPAAVRFVSVEPMLGPVDLTRVGGDRFGWGRIDALNGLCYIRANATESGCEWETEPCAKINLVFCGNESGPHRRTAEIDAIRNLRDQCVASGTKFFLKQMEVNGQLVKMPELDGQRWAQWPVLAG